MNSVRFVGKSKWETWTHAPSWWKWQVYASKV